MDSYHHIIKRYYSTKQISKVNTKNKNDIYYSKVKRYIKPKEEESKDIVNVKRKSKKEILNNIKNDLIPELSQHLMKSKESSSINDQILVQNNDYAGIIKEKKRPPSLQSIMTKLPHANLPNLLKAKESIINESSIRSIENDLKLKSPYIHFNTPITSKMKLETKKYIDLKKPNLPYNDFISYKMIYELMESNKYEEALKLIDDHIHFKGYNTHTLFFNLKMICFINIGRLNEMFDLFNHLLSPESEIKPNAQTFFIICKFYIDNDDYISFNNIINNENYFKIISQHENESYLLKFLYSLMKEKKKVEESIHLFRKIKYPRQVDYERIFHLCNDYNRLDSAIEIYNRLKETVKTSRNVIYLSHSIAKSLSLIYGKANRDDLLESLFNDMEKSSIKPDRAMIIKLMNLWKYSRPLKAIELFEKGFNEKVLKNDIVFLSLGLNIYSHNKDINNAKRIYNYVLNSNVIIPDKIFFNSMLKGYCLTNDDDGVQNVINDMKRYGFTLNNVSLVMLLDFTSRTKGIDQMFHVYNTIPYENNFKTLPHTMFTVVEILLLNNNIHRGLLFMRDNILKENSLYIEKNECNVTWVIGEHFKSFLNDKGLLYSIKDNDKVLLDSNEREKWINAIDEWISNNNNN